MIFLKDLRDELTFQFSLSPVKLVFLKGDELSEKVFSAIWEPLRATP